MRKITLPIILLLFAFTGRGADKPVTTAVTGEIVDLHCYVTHGTHGDEHAKCMNACISRGVPAGLLAENGTLYLLLDEKPFSVKEKIAGKAGTTVTVHGTIVEQSGMKGLQVSSIE